MTRTPDGMEDREFRASRYIDGDLDPAERAQLEAELDRDPLLRDAFEQVRRVDRLAKSWGELVPETDSETFVAEARRRREAYERSRRVVRVYRVFAPLAAAAVLVLVASAYLVIRARLPAEPRAAGPVARVSVGPVDGGGRSADHPEVVTVVSFSGGEPERTVPEAAAHSTLLVAVASIGPSDLGLSADEENPVF